MFDIEFVAPIIQILSSHIWIIGINETNQPFWTSDSPVVTSQHKPGLSESHSYSGIASKGVEIAFPITSRYVLVLCDREVFAHYQNVDCKTVKFNDRHIIYYNSLQVIQSNRQVYSSQTTFDLAKEVCNTYPEVCDPNRTRARIDLIDGHIIGQIGVRETKK